MRQIWQNKSTKQHNLGGTKGEENPKKERKLGMVVALWGWEVAELPWENAEFSSSFRHIIQNILLLLPISLL